MDREAEILQQWIEIAPFQRRLRQPRERIGREQDKQKESRRDPGLHAQHVRLQRRRQILPKAATSAPKEARISTHSSIEPS